MFDFVRNNKRLIQIILAMVTLPFAFWGIESYTKAFNSSQDVAEVAGQKISLQEFAQTQRDQQERLRSMLGRNFDPALLDTPEQRSELLDGLIQQRLLVRQAVKSNLTVSDVQLREIIAALPVFQENGHFSKARYDALLRAQGMNDVAFEARLRQDLLLQQINGAVVESGLVAKSQIDRLIRIQGQLREVSEAVISFEKFAAAVKPADAAVKAYYDGHQAEFQLPELVRAAYVVLNADALLAFESVTEEDMRAWFDANGRAKFEQRAAARKKAEELLAQLRAAPDRFAELAKQQSQDPGSKDNGGDLGYFARGAMVKPFEDAVFKLKEGELSGLVESDFGFHIIKLTGIKPGKGGEAEQRRASHVLINAPAARDFQSMRAEIEQELKKQRVAKRYAEAAETFTNLAYEQPDSLQPIAEKFKLKVQQSQWLTRKPGPAAGADILNNQKLLDALFSSEVLKNKRNTEALEAGPNSLVAARVIEHKPATVRPLNEVKGEIASRLARQRGIEQAQKEGAARFAELKKGNEAGLNWSAPKNVSRQGPPAVHPDALREIFRADVDKLPAYVGVDLRDRGYGLYRISRVADAPVEEARRKGMQEQLARQDAQQGFSAYLASLKADAKIEVNKALLEKKQ
jgi:peptidyl-prolyl cis-trans isomerase D